MALSLRVLHGGEPNIGRKTESMHLRICNHTGLMSRICIMIVTT